MNKTTFAIASAVRRNRGLADAPADSISKIDRISLHARKSVFEQQKK